MRGSNIELMETKGDEQDTDANFKITLNKQRGILALAMAGVNKESLTQNFIEQDDCDDQKSILKDGVRVEMNQKKYGQFDVEFDLFGMSQISREGEISIIIVYLVIAISQFAVFVYAVLITYLLNQWSKDESIQSSFILKFGRHDLNVLQLVKWIRFSAWAVKAIFALFNVLRSYKRQDTPITQYVATLVGFIIPIPLIEHMVTDTTVPPKYHEDDEEEQKFIEEKKLIITDHTNEEILKLKQSIAHIHKLIIRNRFKLQSQVFTTFFDFYCTIFVVPIAVLRSQGYKVEGIKELQKDKNILNIFMAASICLVVNWITSDISSTIHEVKEMLEYTFNIKIIEKQILNKIGMGGNNSIDNICGVEGDNTMLDEQFELIDSNQKPQQVYDQMVLLKKKNKENGYFALYNKNIRPHVIHFEQYQRINWQNKVFLYGYAILLFSFDIFTISVSLCPGENMDKFLTEICTFFSIVSPASIRLSLLITWGTRFLITFCWVIYRYKSLMIVTQDKNKKDEKSYSDSITHLCASIRQNGIFWKMSEDKQLCKTFVEINALNKKKEEIGNDFEDKIKKLSVITSMDLLSRDSIKQWDDIHGRQLTQSPVFLWCLLSIPTPQSIYLFVNYREFELAIRRYSWPKIYIFMRLYCQLYIFYLVLASAAFVKIVKKDYKDQLKLDPPIPIKTFFILLTVVGIAMQLGIQANYFNQERKRMEQANKNKPKGRVEE